MAVYGVLSVSTSTIESNTASSGGGIWNKSGSVTVSSSVVNGNTASSYGGGLMSETTATIQDSTVANNTAYLGGGLFNGGSGTMTVTGSTISGNSTGDGGGGISNYGVLTVSSSSISNNSSVTWGGGIHTKGTFTMIGSTVSGNQTVQNNSAGGGIGVTGGTGTIADSTIAGNSSVYGGGIANKDGTATTTMGNTILAGNTSNTPAPNCYGTINSNDYNLIDALGWCTITGATAHTIYYKNPILGPLQDNGGQTLTYALLSGSPAIDHGNCSAGTDQRGMTRPVGGGCDIGAFEVSSLINLAVSRAGAGSGTIASDTTGINCGGTCSSDFGQGVSITLTATPDPGSVFKGWSNGSGSASGCTGTGACTLTLTADSGVTANFKLTQTIIVTQNAPTTALAGSSFDVTATASSGLDVSITASGTCTGSGTGSATITMSDTAGTCSVHYNQAGDATYDLAQEVVEHTRTGKCSVTVVRTTSVNGSWNNGVWAPSGPGSQVSTDDINLQLDSGTPVTITTVLPAGGTICDTDDIIVAADISSGNANASLTFSMGGSYSLVNGARVTLSGSGPSLSIGGIAYTIINDVNSLQSMTNNLSGHYALGSDIDASATSTWNSGAGFVPVGTAIGGNKFTGVFDGLNHVVTGLFINQEDPHYEAGLFGYINAATVRNVGFKNVNIRGVYGVGALAGYMSGATIANSHATGAVSGTQTVGGLVGRASGTISNSYAMVTASGDYSIGGLVGGSLGGSGTVTIDNCYATGSVSASISYVGGLIGSFGGTIINSYATGSISGGQYAGGLVGYGGGSIFWGRDCNVSSSYASGSVSGTSNVGGLLGYSNCQVADSYWDTQTTGQATSAGGGIGLTTSDMMTQASFTNFDFANTWWISEGNTRPFLRSEYATYMSNGRQLQLMALDPTAYYALAGDIDLASELTNTSGSGGSSSALWGSAGFVPVGDSTNAFYGALDGLGHIITGLAINRPASDNVGLFGAAIGSVQNVGLVGVNVSGSGYVGALAGSGNVTITNAYATGSVSGSNNYVGGLVGENRGNIVQSYSTGTATGHDYVGGLVGSKNGGLIVSSYATVSVTGNNYVGGLVGSTSACTSARCAINCTYAAGPVSGAGSVGGLVGSGTGTVTNSYWDTQTSGQAVSAGGAGKTTAEMMSGLATFSGWDYDNGSLTGKAWRFYEGHTYPLLWDFLVPLTVTADNITSGDTGSAYAGGLVNASFSVPGADTSGRLYGLAAPYNGRINAGSYTPDLWSDQQGYDIAYAGGTLTIAPDGAATPTGDLNGDGAVDVADVLRALRIAQGIIAPTAQDLQYGDVAPMVGGTPQPDGKIDIGDVVLLLRRAVGLVSW